METALDCMPCFIRQALEAVRMAIGSRSEQERVIREVLRATGSMDLVLSPPAVGQRIHRLIRQETGNPDPYRAAKERANDLALALLPEVQGRIDAAADPLTMALRMAIAGNIMDLGPTGDFTEETVRHVLEHAAIAPLEGDLALFAREADVARSILYLADNAGEIVIDGALIQVLGRDRVRLMVRGSPVLNDAVRWDAVSAGLDRMVTVVENGSDAPGTILEDCSPEARAMFEDADLVIAKGQGNYESLSDPPRPVWFLLMAKCPVVAHSLGCEAGRLLARRLPAS
jgi:uncharacterized protein with ATP-grasp and redox domains